MPINRVKSGFYGSNRNNSKVVKFVDIKEDGDPEPDQDGGRLTVL